MTAISSTWFASVVTCVVTVTSGTYYPAIEYVSDYCGRTLYVKSDVRLKLAPTTYLDSNTICSVTLQPYQGSSIVATFLQYSINSAYVDKYGYCLDESIQLSDSSGYDVLGYHEYCNSQKPSGQFNLHTKGTFGYTTGIYTSPYTADVDLLVSAVVINQGTCPTGYFDCQNGNCVTDDVTCNGYDDCGNDSDETDGCGELAVGVIVGIAFGVTFFIIFVVVMTLLFRRYRRRLAYMQYT